MGEPFNPLAPIVTGPLTSDERKLVELAVYEPWTAFLKGRLVAACVDRGILVSNNDDCGDLAVRLEAFL